MMDESTLKKRRYLYYWLAFGISYIIPLAYFAAKFGITQDKKSLGLPVLMVFIIALFKLATDLPRLVSTWEPSFKKGLVKGVPKFIAFIALITFGLVFKIVLEQQIDVAFLSYFETVFVFFGSLSVGAIFDAFHLKYTELYLISKGYVLGVVNKH
jgi:hypothetical protein